MNDLIKLLMSQLGVGDSQAKGALGLIFKLVKDKLAPADFSQVQKSLPGVDDVVKAAPSAGGLGGLLGGLVGAVGGKDAGNLASLAAGFKGLNIGTDKIDDILKTVLGFVKDKGGDNILGLVKKVLG
jgi:hypothetical protein